MITYPTTDSQQCPPAPGDRSKNDSKRSHGPRWLVTDRQDHHRSAGSTKVGSAVFEPPVRRQGMNSRW